MLIRFHFHRLATKPTLYHLTATIVIVASVVIWTSAQIGCSSTRTISNSASEIERIVEDTVDQIEGHADRTIVIISDPGVQMEEALRDEAIEHQNSIKELADKAEETIDGAVGDIHERLTEVEDKVPFWQRLILWGLIAATVIAVIAAAWYSGILSAIGAFLNLIPRRTRSAAAIAAKSISEGEASPREREAIAVQRATDAGFDRAYKKARDIQ